MIVPIVCVVNSSLFRSLSSHPGSYGVFPYVHILYMYVQQKVRSHDSALRRMLLCRRLDTARKYAISIQTIQHPWKGYEVPVPSRDS